MEQQDLIYIIHLSGTIRAKLQSLNTKKQYDYKETKKLNCNQQMLHNDLHFQVYSIKSITLVLINILGKGKTEVIKEI